jgi:hypothetical protein
MTGPSQPMQLMAVGGRLLQDGLRWTAQVVAKLACSVKLGQARLA